MGANLVGGISVFIAAQELETRLREAGVMVTVDEHQAPDGKHDLLVVSAYDTQERVLAWLEHYAVPVELVSCHRALRIYVYNVIVQGVMVTLIVKPPVVGDGGRQRMPAVVDPCGGVAA